MPFCLSPDRQQGDMLDTNLDIISPRSSTDEPRRGEEDVEIDWVLSYDFDDIGTELRDLGLWHTPPVERTLLTLD